MGLAFFKIANDKRLKELYQQKPDLRELTIKDLELIANDRGISLYKNGKKLRKNELIDAILDAKPITVRK